MISVELGFDSDSDEESNRNETCLLKRKRRLIRDASNPLDLDEFCFIQTFRLTKDTFINLLEDISPKMTTSKRSSSIPEIIKLACTLRFFAQGSYQSSVGNDFQLGLAQSTVSVVLKEMFDILEECLCVKWINLICTEEEKVEAKLYFYEKSSIPGIIGAVDGTHIRIRAPKKEIQHLYYNRKGFYSLNAMFYVSQICDHKMRIRYVDARYPGATHDSLVWNMSAGKREFEERYQNGERNTWLVGDAGYPLSTYLLTPFRSVSENSNELIFNTKHSKARTILERTIGVIKNRFRCLLGAREVHYTPEKSTKIVNICAALHNICIQYKIDSSQYENDSSERNENVNIDNSNEFEIENNEAINIRNSILNAII